MKRMQLTGIALLLMTGIPVISMAQNKVEADSPLQVRWSGLVGRNRCYPMGNQFLQQWGKRI